MTHDMGKLIEFNTSCASVFTQRAGVVALQRTAEVTPRVVAHLKACRDTLVPLLQAVPGVQVAPAPAACTLFSGSPASTTRWPRPNAWWSRPAWAWRRAKPSPPKRRAGCAGASPRRDPQRLVQGVGAA